MCSELDHPIVPVFLAYLATDASDFVAMVYVLLMYCAFIANDSVVALTIVAEGNLVLGSIVTVVHDQ